MKTEKITVTALLLAVSFALSALEGFVPIGLLIPIPGLKLGLANIAVMAALLLVGKGAALTLVLLRPLLSLLVFGNATSCLLSLSGGMLAFSAVLLMLPLYRRVFSLGGISVLSAVCHGTGQIAAASMLMGSGSLFLYLPLLGAASAVTGLVTGWLMNVVMERLWTFRSGREDE